MPSENTRTGRILVVDDEPLIRWSLSEGLSRAGHAVSEAEDRKSALELITREVPFDVVFLDLRLPDSSDLGLLGRIHELCPTSVVILMTAHGSPEVFEQAEREGARWVVGKPFDVERMVALAADSLQPR